MAIPLLRVPANREFLYHITWPITWLRQCKFMPIYVKFSIFTIKKLPECFYQITRTFYYLSHQDFSFESPGLFTWVARTEALNQVNYSPLYTCLNNYTTIKSHDLFTANQNNYIKVDYNSSIKGLILGFCTAVSYSILVMYLYYPYIRLVLYK